MRNKVIYELPPHIDEADIEYFLGKHKKVPKDVEILATEHRGFWRVKCEHYLFEPVPEGVQITIVNLK